MLGCLKSRTSLPMSDVLGIVFSKKEEGGHRNQVATFNSSGWPQLKELLKETKADLVLGWKSSHG